MMTRGIEVWTKAETGEPWIGKVVGDFVKSDGTQWVVLESPKFGVWLSPSHAVRNIRELYLKTA